MMKCTIFSVVFEMMVKCKVIPDMDDFAMTYGHFMNTQEM